MTTNNKLLEKLNEINEKLDRLLSKLNYRAYPIKSSEPWQKVGPVEVTFTNEFGETNEKIQR